MRHYYFIPFLFLAQSGYTQSHSLSLTAFDSFRPGDIQNLPLPPPLTSVQKEKSVIICFFEKMPEFNGDLNEYLAEHLKYPPEAKQKRIEGTVGISFIIDERGIIQDIKLLKSAHPLLDQEALRLVAEMPPWKPAMQNDKAIPMRYTIPVRFKIDDEKNSNRKRK